MDWSPLFISLKTSFCATIIAFLFGVLTARFVLGVGVRWRGFLDVLLTLPLVLPPTVVGFGLLLFFGWNSPIGQILRSVGIRIVFSWEATVIASSVVAFPLIYRTVRASFEQIDPAVIDVARTLGLSERVIFCRVMLPMSLPGCVAGAVLGFARALGEFGATLMIAGNIPQRTQTIPVAIWSAVEGNNMQEAAIWVLLIVIISFLIILPLNLYRHK
ncbi:MAG: molybdate ABC transporter permease subunit [Planctomycetaceae bacterium]|jgi:molybdate transport system permease protein|nr:molybdate ABC transporter permease subunit [Planctomycetaceae bacterium]